MYLIYGKYLLLTEGCSMIMSVLKVVASIMHSMIPSINAAWAAYTLDILPCVFCFLSLLCIALFMWH